MKKSECWRINAFELWYWRRFLRIPWTARRSNQSILKDISPEYSLEGLMLKLKHQHFGHLMWRTDSLERPWCWERLKAGGEGDDREWDSGMASLTWWTWACANSGDNEGQGSQVCCSPWGHKELDTTVTEQQQQHLYQWTLCKTDHLSSCGWTSSYQWKTLKTKAEVPQRRRNFASRLQCRNPACFPAFKLKTSTWLSNLLYALQIWDFTALTIAWTSCSGFQTWSLQKHPLQSLLGNAGSEAPTGRFSFKDTSQVILI